MTVDRERLLRRGAVFAGVPLSLALLVPYPIDGGWKVSWEMAGLLDAPSFVVAPAAGLVMLLAVTVPRLPHLLRAFAVALAGVVAALSVRELLLHPDVIREAARDARELSLSAVDGLLAAWLGACALEVALQRRRGSRLWAALALLGWLHLLARWLVPLADMEVESTPLVGMAELIGELADAPGLVLLLVPALLYLAVPSMQALLTLLRLASSEGKRADRPWRSSWPALLLAVLPAALVGLAFALVGAVEGELELLAVAVDAGGILLGATLGAVWGVGFFLPALGDAVGRVRADFRAEEPGRRRRARAIAVVATLLVVGWAGHRVWRWTRPDPVDRALVSLVEVTEQAVLAATTDRPYDPRWNGGYSDLDIRASRGALLEHVGQGPVEPALFAFELAGHGGVPFEGRVVVLDDEVRWARLARGWPGGELRPLDRVPALEATVLRGSRALGSGDCVEPLGSDDLEGLPPRAAELLDGVESVERACDEMPDRARSLDDARPEVRGSLGSYLMLVRSGERWLALRGSWHVTGGRLWLGRVEIEPL